jgi:hypothetical protein
MEGTNAKERPRRRVLLEERRTLGDQDRVKLLLPAAAPIESAISSLLRQWPSSRTGHQHCWLTMLAGGRCGIPRSLSRDEAGGKRTFSRTPQLVVTRALENGT